MWIINVFKRKKKQVKTVKGSELLERIRNRPVTNAYPSSRYRDSYSSANNSRKDDSPSTFFDIGNTLSSYFDNDSSPSNDSGSSDTSTDFGGGSGDGGGASGDW